MFKLLSTAVLSASLALGAPAAPARADSGETARLVAGLTLLAIIAAAASKSKDRKVEVHRANPAPPPYYDPGPSHGGKRDDHRDWDRDWDRRDWDRRDWGRDRGRDWGQKGGRYVIPAACARTIRDAGGQRRTVYPNTCLQRAEIDRLPRACAFEVKIEHRWTKVYGERCLAENGFRIASR